MLSVCATCHVESHNTAHGHHRYCRIDFAWDQAGLVDVVAHFVAIPDVTLSLKGDSIDRTVLVSFVLLVVMIAAQARLLMYTIFHGFQQTGSTWTLIQAS